MSTIVYIGVLLFCGIYSNVSGASIELFSDIDYVGTIPFGTKFSDWREQPSSCFNFPWYNKNSLSSIKTNGHCVLLFSHESCEGSSIKVDQDISDISSMVGVYTNDDFDNKAVSLMACNQYEGGSEVNIDVFNLTDYEDPILEYSGVCRCLTIPPVLQTISSVDNHHHCIRFYTSGDCNSEEGLYQDVYAGKSSVSADLTKTDVFGKIRSFRPCQVSKSEKCQMLKAEIYEFHISEDPNSPLHPKTTKINMASKTTFVNNGTATVAEEYHVRQIVRESTAFEKIKLNRQIQSWETSMKTKAVTNVGFMNSFSKISKSYEYTCDFTESESKETGDQTREVEYIEEEREFSVKQVIEVPPCSTYDVEPTVHVVEDYPITYDVFFKISGVFDGKKMTAEELREEVRFMPEYKYNHTIDRHSISAYGTATIIASFGVEAEVYGEGKRIAGCNPLA